MNINDSIVVGVSTLKTVFETEATTTRTGWQDCVSDRFFNNHVEPYIKAMDLYVNGGMEIKGKGVAELIDYLNEKGNKMSSLI